jgi:hypothetical protein
MVADDNETRGVCDRRIVGHRKPTYLGLRKGVLEVSGKGR